MNLPGFVSLVAVRGTLDTVVTRLPPPLLGVIGDRAKSKNKMVEYRLF